MCVAVSSALAAKEMPRQDASVMAIFGSGWQAGAHVTAFCAVRELKKITPIALHRPIAQNSRKKWKNSSACQ
jgi:ornithine cyclodeaminase/alanine dehydrogenase-like protein (mu-crystallin family)